MAKERIIVFEGESGNKYQFTIYPANTNFNENIGAVYVFCSKNIKGFTPLYIGETGELGKRIADHEKWDCVLSHDCTHICIRAVSGRDERLDIETDLRHNYNTPCNEQ